MGVQPVMINSALVSAQNRVRFYWTNIGEIEQPEDRGILLKDIIESGTNIDADKARTIDANYFKGGKIGGSHQSSKRNYQITGGAIRGRYNEDGKTEQKLEVQHTGRANSITTVQKDSLCIQVGEADLKGHDSIKRVYSPDGKSPTLTTMGGGHREPKIAQPELTWRKLTPLECERLQTVPDFYTEGVSNTQRYRMLGNGWTVEVIKHIFNKML